ncbi:MAG: KH domain-containing protein [Deltaproteobacteria bacterium]|jgi:predicted RNA-binding protein YlqC (UPF0109 family)|nr:KH domain-containing protein [Deltaproteobacteria bacterium]
MKELIEYIAKALVDYPEQVSVNALEGSQATVLELSVAKVDLGKVIGKQGRTAKAIRIILGAASAKIRKRAILEIVE